MARQIDYRALVNKLDPKRLSRKEPQYLFSGSVVKKQYQTRPGQTYRWYR